MKNLSTAIIFLFLLTLMVYYPKSIDAKSGLRVPILMYHYIGINPNPGDKNRNPLSTSPQSFEEQMQYLSKEGFTPITLDTLYPIFAGTVAPPQKPVVLTFDDGYLDFYTTAFPVLKRYGFHAVAFIPTDLMNGGQFMTWDQIKEIQKSGLITFESHSVHHVDFTKLDFNTMKEELKESKSILERMTGYPVNFIAYPAGRSNDLVRKTASQIGYVGGISTWYGRATYNSFAMPRVRIPGGISIAEFARRVN